MPFDPTAPFYFFEDASAAGPGLLFAGAERWIEAQALGDVRPALSAVRAALADGKWVAGTLAYEAAGALEPRMARDANLPQPLVRFGVFAAPDRRDWSEVGGSARHRRTTIRDLTPGMDQAAYEAMVETALAYIRAGDIYQANMTLQVAGRFAGHPLALWDRLRRSQRMGEGALVREPDGRWLLSASPELFFACGGRRVIARPMKGTARRRPDAASDRQAAKALAADEKNRAENLMITDLIRNDLSRTAVPGSVTVPDPFVVETYPTLHTMVSGVEAALRENLGPVDILETMFPCGSITGAPKVRAGQIINELERAGRGIYTGSIGWIAPGGDARFNVAIRTAVIEGQRLSLGVGAGIVSDSVPADEWRECQTKAAFLTARARPFHLIETMRFVPSEGVANLDLHMQRLEKSAGYFGRPFDEQRAVRDLESVTSLLSAPSRIRMLLDQDGRVAVSASPIPPSKPVLDITVAPLPVPPDDWRLFHKSSDRAFYDQARQDSDADEVVFERPDGLLTEGSFTNLFVRRGSRLLTPHAASGLLPGILRARLIADRKAVEADLTVDDLRGGEVFVGNALRGLVPAHHVARRQGAS